nr:uncharacterized protein LOC109164031 [Ipomoea trifida]GMD57194.1 uncharacterized protein LOC109164031 [Ipomoea batatas]
MNSWYEFEVGSESDVFFDELRKQVLQLTADDDDEEFPGLIEGSSRYLKNERGPNNKSSGSSSVVQLGCEYEWTGSMDRSKVPQWLLDLWRTENKDAAAMFNGTGVFIPHIVNTRRRYKPKKKNNERGRVYKPVAKFLIVSGVALIFLHTGVHFKPPSCSVVAALLLHNNKYPVH